MALWNERELRPTQEAEGLYRRWLAHLNEQFTSNQTLEGRAEIVRDELHQLFLGRAHGGRSQATLAIELGNFALTETFDPRNATLEPEYTGDIDWEQYGPRKPLIWFWRMFDRSPLGANVWLGFRFRCMIGQHIFRQMGKGVKIFENVEFARGYNLTIEDNCTIHRGAWLDDRSELVLRAGTNVTEGERVPKQAA